MRALLAALLLLVLVPPPASSGGGGPTTIYPQADYDIDGSALYCDHSPTPIPTIVMIAFEGTVNGVPTSHAVIEMTVLPVAPGNVGCSKSGGPIPTVRGHVHGTATGSGVG